ncbi:MAG: helix-turn-helix domain-containing protein [Candidatus Cloacimonetes bacterium]|jgi:excisionase family DNA binding protein|nr:helix-turn-helix domain-containing protein [Candidatus Cloacimonadota bacterium]
MADIKVFTLDEVADILKVTKRTLYNYVKAGKLPAVKIGKYWRVSEESLQAFISTGTPILEENRRKENQSKES